MSRAGTFEASAWRRRGDMALRVVSAIPLGYAVASLWAMAIARLLPGARSEATIVASLIAFVICAVAAMWAFAARSGWRAFWTLALAGGAAGTIAWTSIAMSGRP
ncbi:hypothetical protein [Allosphingosinicella deserti]|nr:hypothetical protein [Sphingomonas deserti]